MPLVAARLVAAFCLAGAISCSRHPPAGPVPAPTTSTAGFRRVPLGLCEDYPEETRSLEEVTRDLAVVKAAGLEVLRVSIGWDDVEPEDDQFVFTFWDQVIARAETAGVRLLPYVAYAPAWSVALPGRPVPDDHWRQPPADPREFGEVMEVLARRYRGRIRSWELWNEPDNAEYWRGTLVAYAALLEAGAAGVRRGDPAALTVMGGLAGTVPFLQELFRQHRAAAFVDVVNVHAYFETWNGEPLERLPGYLDEVAAAIAPGGPRPIWLAEVGYGNFRRGAEVSPYYRSRYHYEHRPPFAAVALARTVTMALASPHPTLIAWYELKDPPPVAAVIGDVNNRHLGVTYNDRRPKPALATLSFLARLFRGGYRVVPTPRVRPRPTGRAAPPLRLHGFLLDDDSVAIAAWIPTNDPDAPGPAPARDAAGDAPDPRRLSFDVALPCVAAGPLVIQDQLGGERGRLPAPALATDGLWAGPVEVQGGEFVVLRIYGCQMR
jgi:hypothetical protein